jgi:Zn-dependent protease with chaperone function
MVTTMDANAKKVFADAYATLDRVAHVEVEPRNHHDDPLTRWAAGMPKQPEPTPVSQARTLTDAEVSRWQAYVSDQIAAAIKQHAEVWREVMARALASERQRHRAEIAKLDLRISASLAEVSKRQAVDAAIIDLPKLPLRGRRA